MAEMAIPVTNCRACGGVLEQVLDLGEQPACDHFPLLTDPEPDERWPLALAMCRRCALVQLDHLSPAPEEPLAVESATLQRHAREASRRVVERLGITPGSTVREFNSHHGGSWLESLENAGLTQSDSPADLVVDNQAIIHSEDPDVDMRARTDALAPGGRLVIEFHHALRQLADGQFDTVRHGHPLYFSLHSWQALCARHGLTVVDAWPEDVFGGCLVVAATRGEAQPSSAVDAILAEENAAGVTSPQGYRSLQDRAREVSADLTGYLEAAGADGRRVVAYGAGSKSCTLLGVAGVTRELLPMTADLSPGKHDRRIPGTGIPIVSPEALVASEPDEVLVLLWDIADEVVGQLRASGLTSPRYLVPMPTVSEIR